jgi:hypothetical protein
LSLRSQVKAAREGFLTCTASLDVSESLSVFLDCAVLRLSNTMGAAPFLYLVCARGRLQNEVSFWCEETMALIPWPEKVQTRQ